MKWYYKYGFSTSQYKGLTLIVVLILIVAGVNIYQNQYTSIKIIDFEPFPKDTVYTAKAEITLQEFDPNLVDEDFFISTGLDRKLASRIIKYRNAGGKFYKSKDLLKIYNIDSIWYFNVAPYINIEKRKTKSTKKKLRLKGLKPFNLNTITSQELSGFNIPIKLSKTIISYRIKIGGYKNKKELLEVYGLTDEVYGQLESYIIIEEKEKGLDKPVALLELNTADSVQLVSLYGVGPIYAQRIIKYRNKLGGFYSKKQLLEVYGMDSIRYDGFAKNTKVDSNFVIYLEINKAEFKILLSHPYLNYEQVKSIYDYREQMGKLKSVDELMRLEGFNLEDQIKLRHYMLFN